MAETFPVDNAVPLPPRTSGRKNGALQKIAHTLRRLDVGDSFFVPDEEANADSISSAMSNETRLTGWKFARRRWGPGYRIWRLDSTPDR